ncbi:MAG: NTP transferase domain-containing protein [Myxococcales bacterium]|nr:NTP transferase domain-containing protein [Myxococcales bacterium]
MAQWVGLIPAAGRGVRAHPYTQRLPKCLLEVDGVPLLQRNLELMRDELGIEEVVIVVGHEGDRIREFVGDGSAFGLRVRCIENDQLNRDLAWSLHLGFREIDAPALVLLSDEFYLDCDHRRLREPPLADAFLTCGLVESDSSGQVRKNYSVDLDGDRVRALIEKPREVHDRWMGVGSYLVSVEAMRALSADFDGGRGPADWTTWIHEQAEAGRDVRACRLGGHYVNVNDREALNHANHVARSQDFDRRRVSVVYLVEHAAANVLDSIRSFAAAPGVDELLVAAREASPVWEAAQRLPKVRLFLHPRGFVPMGRLLKDALDDAAGDVLVTTWSDDTFSPRDLAKLLVYLQDADLVVGTRTTRQMVEQGSNMRGSVRAAHIALAKLMELLWWGFDARFSDVCCVYRAVWRSTWLSIRDRLHCDDVEVFPEMVIEVLRARRRVIEIPVNYFNRDPEAPGVRSEHQKPGTFFRILALMVRKRIRSAGAAPAPHPVGAAAQSRAAVGPR